MELHSAQFKIYPEDFIVTELLPIANDLSGQGEHLWLYLQKTGVNTAYLAKLLAQWAKIPIGDVGYSGLKDRNAVTYQWFSLRLPKATLDTNTLSPFLAKHLNDNESVELIKHHRHHKKLQIGSHFGNHFTITLRQVSADTSLINSRLATLAKIGFPNYFGKQRFGHDNNNLTEAYELFTSKKRLKAIKYGKRPANFDLLLSAVRSHLFNAILAQRISLDNWHQAIDGDVFMLDGSQSVFTSSITQEITKRLLDGDIHPTAPLVGIGGKQATATAYVLEQAILTHDNYSPLVYALTYLGIKQHRRALRVMPQHLSYKWSSNERASDTLTLQFELPKGAFATALLDAIIDELIDASIAKN